MDVALVLVGEIREEGVVGAVREPPLPTEV